ncbi:UNVERIFIED_CONTAM: hypothetical protein FKN15_032143 [Acipenser sinensis]
MDFSWNYRFGIIILGDSFVGKSSLLQRYTEGMFDKSRQSPLGIDFKVRHLEFEPGISIKLLLWDTAGQERFRSISRSYMRNSVGCLLVFDLTKRETFERLRDWYIEVTNYVKPSKMVFILIGHKCDLKEEQQVSKDEAEGLAVELGIAHYVEASAKDNLNVDSAFERLTMEIYELFHAGRIPIREGWYGLSVGVPVDLYNPDEPKTEKPGCC